MIISEEQRERYSRQMLLEEFGEEGQRKLMDSKVLVVGAGGLGSAALMYLAASGVGTIGIVDGDELELSNMNRQVIHKTENMGRLKAESAAERIRELNPNVKTRIHPFRITEENGRELVAEYDFVVDAVDSFESKLVISDACVAEKVPFVHSGIVRYSGQIMTYVPGKGPCLRCILGDEPVSGDCFTCSTLGVLGAAVGTFGTMEATEAIKYLTGIGELLTGRVLFFDAMTMDFQITEVPESSPHCKACNTYD